MMGNLVGETTWQALDCQPWHRSNPSFQSSWTTSPAATPSFRSYLPPFPSSALPSHFPSSAVLSRRSRPQPFLPISRPQPFSPVVPVLSPSFPFPVLSRSLPSFPSSALPSHFQSSAVLSRRSRPQPFLPTPPPSFPRRRESIGLNHRQVGCQQSELVLK